MLRPIATYVYASDPISQVGVVSQLRMRPEIRVLEAAGLDQCDVAVVVTREREPAEPFRPGSLVGEVQFLERRIGGQRLQRLGWQSQ